ncbi:MAG: SPFH domain-containing protein [Azonexus sp.]
MPTKQPASTAESSTKESEQVKPMARDYETQDRGGYTPKPSGKNPLISLTVIGVLALVLIIGFFMLFDITTIKGHQLGVKETWKSGVLTEVYQPKMYFLMPGETLYPYDASSQVFVMNDKPMHMESKTPVGREKDAYKVQSSEGQDMTISLNLRWRINPEKLVAIHKTVRDDIEEKLIRPVVMRVVKDEATRMKAVDAYSGEGLVRLQTVIQSALTGAGEGAELKERGVIVENFVIEHIELDPKYIDEIKGKQLATQQTLRAAEEQKAAEAKALVAKAEAQADFNKRSVEAERDAKVMVTAAQAENEKAILTAKAEQQKLTLEAEGKKAAMIATAEGTLAMGKAEATSKELLLKAWAVPGAEAFVKVEISKNLGTAFSGIKGYLPSDMKVNLITDNFVKAVDTITGSPVVAIPQPAPAAAPAAK